MKSTRNLNLLLGVKKIEYTTIEQISSETPRNNYSTQLTIPFGNWNELYFTPNSGFLQQKVSTKDHGVVYDQVLKCKIPGYDVLASFEQNNNFYYTTKELGRKQFVFRITLCNNMLIFTGRRNDPYVVQSDFTIQKVDPDTELMFKRESREQFNGELAKMVL